MARRERERRVERHLEGLELRIGLVVARFNETVTERLLASAEACLERHGCTAERRRVVHVPGSFELPLAAASLARAGGVDAIVALGALIRGETAHFDVLAREVAHGLGRVALDTGIPVVFGVLTTEDEKQALDRADGEAGDKGWEAALAALEMVDVLRRLR